MREGGRGIALVCALLVGWSFAVKPANAQPKRPAAAGPANAPPSPPGPKPLAETLTGDAKTDYDAGKLLIGDGDFVGAEVKFKSAYELSKDPRLLWNIAACEKSQRHYARTLALLRQYVSEGGALLTDADRAEAKALVDTIESFTVKLTVSVNQADADVVVDDEKVGTSPLPAPLVVDIGSRKIVVKKTGFKDSVQTIPIGGSAEAHVDVTLVAEVHEGNLRVTTLEGATIFIDGRPVGTGRFEDTIQSGGHTLRVQAPGMHPYQSEITIADDENRSVDVPLEKEYVPPPTEDKGPGFELGLQYGPGLKLHGDKPLEQMVRVDVGWHPGWPTNLGAFLEFGEIGASDACGTSMHGPLPTTPTDLDVRYSFEHCMYFKTGLQFAVHMLPAHKFDPWIAFEPGFRLTFYKYQAFDPLGETQNGSSNGGPMPGIDLGLRAGLDFHPLDTYRPWAIAPYVSLVVTPAANENPAQNNGNNNNGGSNNLQPGGNNDNSGGAVSYLSFFFGVRTSLAF